MVINPDPKSSGTVELIRHSVHHARSRDIGGPCDLLWRHQLDHASYRGGDSKSDSPDVDVLLDDSQEDSQVDGQRRSLADICEFSTTMSKLRRTPMDAGGHQTRGLQNRLRALKTRAMLARVLFYVAAVPECFR